MITPNDVPASRLIQKLAKYLKENIDVVTPPAWTAYAKTGMQAHKAPQDTNWWYTRCASVLRKIYVSGPVGIQKLRADYGGRKDGGTKPEHAARAGGSTIRKALQQLQAAGYVQTLKTRGRKVTREGRKLLQEIAEDVNKQLVQEIPEMAKYQKGE